jgi:hypothetical protein
MLCSKARMERDGNWPCPMPGGDALSHSLDRYNENWDKLSLTFTPNTPMAYWKKRQLHLCFFVMKPSVATLRGVIFTDTNATTTTRPQQRGEGYAGLGVVNFAAIRSTPRPWDQDGWKSPVQAEILIPDCLPMEFVTEIAFVSNASRAEAERLWGCSPHPPFTVNQRYFADTWNGSHVSLNFPYLRSLSVTDQQVTKENVQQKDWPNLTSFRSTSPLTAIAKLYAPAGTRAQFVWKPTGRVDATEFDQSANWSHWSSCSAVDLSSGPAEIEYWIRDVRWATLSITIGNRRDA